MDKIALAYCEMARVAYDREFGQDPQRASAARHTAQLALDHIVSATLLDEAFDVPPAIDANKIEDLRRPTEWAAFDYSCTVPTGNTLCVEPKHLAGCIIDFLTDYRQVALHEKVEYVPHRTLQMIVISLRLYRHESNLGPVKDLPTIRFLNDMRAL